MNLPIDQAIDEAHSRAEAVEAEARQVEARICRIPGADRLLPARRYGCGVDAAAIAKNLTLRALIARNDAPLAAWLGIQDGSHRRAEEQREAAALQAEAMRLRTERLQASNAARREHHERAARAGLHPLTGRRWGA